MTNQDTNDLLPSTAFNDPRNITVGNARVIWANACGRHPEGYVLPGGARTQNPQTALMAAVRMHRMMLVGWY